MRRVLSASWWCLCLIGCGSSHVAPDGGRDGAMDAMSPLDATADVRDAAPALDVRVADARILDVPRADAGTPSFACDETDPIELGRSATRFGTGEPTVVADPFGWVAVWALYEGVFAARPGSAPVRLFDEGASVEAIATDAGVLVCAWTVLDAPGQCLTLDGSLLVIDGPHEAAYGTAVGFAHFDGALHAVQIVLPTVSEPSTFALVPIDTSGQRVGATTVLPCGGHYPWEPAWTSNVIACVVASDPVCGTEAFCPLALRLVSPDGGVLAPDVPIPIAPPGRDGHDVRVAASGAGFLVSWIDSDGLHTLPVSDGGVAGRETHVGRVPAGHSHHVVGLESGYAVFYPDPYDGRDGALGVWLLSREGHPVAAPRAASASVPGGHGLPVAGASAGAGWAVAWLERAAEHAIYFRAFGCPPPLGACEGELAACASADGSLVCVDTESERCHCGACPTMCDGACVEGDCVPCALGTTACPSPSCTPWGASSDAVCFDLERDPAHCGTCESACASGERCVQGVCCAAQETSCGAGGGGDVDCDGQVGCADCDCWATGACGFASPGRELDCRNGFSEDFDGLVDCADPDCASASPCGGPGRCPGTDLGTAFPVAQLMPFSELDRDLSGSCGTAGAPEVTFRWTAPSTRRYVFSAGGTWPARPIVYLLDGGCDGVELGCAESDVGIELLAGQTVVIAIEGGSACHQLAIR